MIAGDHIDKNHQPSKLSSFTCNVLRVRALSFGVQTSHIRKPFKQSHKAILFAGIPVQGTKYCE